MTSVGGWRSMVLCGAALLATACAVQGGARRKFGDEGMAITAADLEAPTSPSVAGAVAVGAFDGGTVAQAYPEEAESFRSALPQSLRVAGLLSADAAAPLAVETRLVEAAAGGEGFQTTVTLKVRYTVKETRSGGVVIDELVTTSHTATGSDSLAGSIRRRLATEASARKSFVALVKRLNSIQRKAPAAAPAQ